MHKLDETEVVHMVVEQSVLDRLTRIEGHLESMSQDLRDLKEGELPNCVRHDKRIESLETDLRSLREDQRWLRRQWTIAWMGIGGSFVVAALMWVATHLEVLG